MEHEERRRSSPTVSERTLSHVPNAVGGGYFSRVDVPTFTADNAAPVLSTASSEPLTSFLPE
jgi:hypothetical protein